MNRKGCVDNVTLANESQHKTFKIKGDHNEKIK